MDDEDDAVRGGKRGGQQGRRGRLLKSGEWTSHLARLEISAYRATDARGSGREQDGRKKEDLWDKTGALAA